MVIKVQTKREIFDSEGAISVRNNLDDDEFLIVACTHKNKTVEVFLNKAQAFEVANAINVLASDLVKYEVEFDE